MIVGRDRLEEGFARLVVASEKVERVATQAMQVGDVRRFPKSALANSQSRIGLPKTKVAIGKTNEAPERIGIEPLSFRQGVNRFGVVCLPHQLVAELGQSLGLNGLH